ncbi:hypothetical protein D9M72_495800 [compost metagenome]
MQLALLPLTESERSKAFGRLASGVSGDHEITELERLRLGPGLRATTPIGCRGTLRNDPLQPQFRGLVVKPMPIAFDMVAELDGRTTGNLPLEQLRQQRLAPFQRNLGQVPPVEMEDIESIEDELAVDTGRKRVLQEREAADALVI